MTEEKKRGLPVPKLHCPAPYISAGKLVVTDWNGRLHRYTDHTKGLAYAASLYNRLPESVPTDTKAYHWQHMAPILTFHAERHKFSHGRAKK